MLVPILAGLTAFALLWMVGLGDGTRSRTQTRTAADAAALAAADAWRDQVDAEYEQVLTRRPGWVPVLIRLLGPGGTARLGADATSAAEAAAAQYAAENGAQVTAFTWSVAGGGIRYRVGTRSASPAQDTGVYTTAAAVATVQLTGGLCFVDGGERLGIVAAGRCLDPWHGTPPAVLPPTLPPTLPVPLRPEPLSTVSRLIQ